MAVSETTTSATATARSARLPVLKSIEASVAVITVSDTALKTLDTIGYCQRPILSFGVSQPMHKITNLCKFELNWSSKLSK